MANGWAQLGELVAGGGNDGREAYVDQLRANGQAADAMWQARKRRAMAINQEGITPDAFIAAGVSPEQAGLSASIVGASANPDFKRAGLSELADMELQREAVEAARTGNVDLLNRLNAVRGDKLIKRTEIESGQAFDPYGLPTQDVMLTPLGESEVATDAALGDQRRASGDAALVRADAAARRDDARADLYGRTDPNRAKAPAGLADFGRVRGGATTVPEGGFPGAPKPGTIMDGYRFKGGNPADPASWERI